MYNLKYLGSTVIYAKAPQRAIRPNFSQEGLTMEIGMFLMPAHPPERTLYDATRWDLDIELADQLSYVSLGRRTLHRAVGAGHAPDHCCWRRCCCAPRLAQVRTCCPSSVELARGWLFRPPRPRVGSCSAWAQRLSGDWAL